MRTVTCISGVLTGLFLWSFHFISNDYVPPVVTDLCFQQERWRWVMRSPLKQSTIIRWNCFEIDQNSFFSWLRLHIMHLMNTLMYKLEGYDSEWRVAGNAPMHIRICLLIPQTDGEGANSDGLWIRKSVRLRYMFFYLSTAAYICCLHITSVGINLLCVFLFEEGKSKNTGVIWKIRAGERKELYISKIEFFTNVAHEMHYSAYSY